MTIEGDLRLISDIGFPHTAERIREHMRKSAVEYSPGGRVMCEQFDAWLADDQTHWISDQDAAYQGWMACYGMMTGDDPPFDIQRPMCECGDSLAEGAVCANCFLAEHGKSSPEIGQRYYDDDGKLVAVVVPADLLVELACDLEVELKANHIDHPLENRRLARDMEVVERARKILEGS